MNNKKILSASPNSRLWDREARESVRGLNIRVTSKGRKNFYFCYRTKDKRQKSLKIGEYGIINLKEARRFARNILKAQCLNHDVAVKKEIIKKEENKLITINDLFKLVLKEHWSKEQFKKSGHLKIVTNYYHQHIAPHFGKKHLDEITTKDVRSWHNSLAHVPVSANRTKEILSKMYNYAIDAELYTDRVNPCKGIKPHSEQSRNRYATPEELKRIIKILDREFKTFPNAVVFLYLLLFTGSRPRAIERAKWEDIKIIKKDGAEFGILTFWGKSSAKTGENEIVVIPPQAMEKLSRLPRLPNSTITNCKLPSKLWQRIRKEAGCPDLWARDLRRTFATIGLSNGVGIDKIGEVLNHKSTQTTKIYSKLMNKERIDTVTNIANSISDILKS